MSTRCHIQVKEASGKIYPIMIYKHSDGYPEGVLPFLKDFTEKFVKDRGDDPEYCVAQILRHWAIEDNENCEQRIIKYKADAKKEGRTDAWIPSNYARQYIGWGVCLASEPHGDIEYMYTVNLKTGKVRMSKPTRGLYSKNGLRPDVMIG